MVTKPRIETLRAAAAIAAVAWGAALAALGCNSCSGPPEAKDPDEVGVPSASGSSTAPPGNPEIQERATGGCVIGGCAGELCQVPEMPEMATACIQKPEWDCYKTAQCARTEQNGCDWVMTPELDKCLKVSGKEGTQVH